MADIPGTRDQFARLDSYDQNKIKAKLLQRNFSTMCDSISTKHVDDFAPVLHPGELQELNLSTHSSSSSKVISSLLLKVSRSLKRKPTWWNLLDDVLREEEYWKLYLSMNPWERSVDGRIHGGDSGGRGDQRRGYGGRPTPSSPAGPDLHDSTPGDPGSTRIPMINNIGLPYLKSTPLATTRGIQNTLKPLFADGNDVLWRELADELELNLGDQMAIITRSQGRDNMHSLLLEHYIMRYGDVATVGCLVTALLALGEEGQRVVREMEQRNLILPVETEGSEAMGNVARVYGDEERTGGTSSRFVQAPIPSFPTDQRDRTPNIGSGNADTFHRSRSEAETRKSSPFPRVASSPADSVAAAGQYNVLDESPDSFVDNTIQSTTVDCDDRKPRDPKILNSNPDESTMPSPDITGRDNMDFCRMMEQRSSMVESKAENAVVEEDCHAPGIPSQSINQVTSVTQQTNPTLIQDSQMLNENQELASLSQCTTPSPQPRDATGNITNIYYVERVGTMLMGENTIVDKDMAAGADKDERNESQLTGEVNVEDIPTSICEASAVNAESTESNDQAQEQTDQPVEESEESEESLDPLDPAHATHVKQVYSGEGEEEHSYGTKQDTYKEEEMDIVIRRDTYDNSTYSGNDRGAGQRTPEHHQGISVRNTAELMTASSDNLVSTSTDPSPVEDLTSTDPSQVEDHSIVDASSVEYLTSTDPSSDASLQQHHGHTSPLPPSQPRPPAPGGLRNRLSQAVAFVQDALAYME